MSIARTQPYLCKLKERSLLTRSGSTKATYHISLDTTPFPLHFQPGDSLGIYAQNDPLLVDHLLHAMKAKGEEEILDPRSGMTCTVRHFLTYKANLSRLTSSFLKLLHEYELSYDKKNQLQHLLQVENKPLLSQYLQLRDPLDLLKEYAAATAPLQDLCGQFGPLLPRFYSVASSLQAYPNEVHLTVALSTFTHAGEQRFGVASHFLSHLAELDKTPIPVYVQPAHHFRLPSNPNTSIIMIGPGTGVAPFRAFMQERRITRGEGKNWLFFGERQRTFDYFYEDFWDILIAEDLLRLDLAFSRDQEEKIYVQDKMREQGAELWSWLQGGSYLYLCGDAQKMAKDVDATLQKIAIEEGGLTPEAAKAYFKTMRNEKRYLLDIY